MLYVTDHESGKWTTTSQRNAISLTTTRRVGLHGKKSNGTTGRTHSSHGISFDKMICVLLCCAFSRHVNQKPANITLLHRKLIKILHKPWPITPKLKGMTNRGKDGVQFIRSRWFH